MSRPNRQTGARLDDELLERVERFAKHRESELPGMKITRSDAIRLLLEKALTDFGYAKTIKKHGTR